MVSRYERQARERQDEVTRLEAELAEWRQAKTRAEANLGHKIRWRDRNRFFNALLHGELVVYEQTAPRWRKYKHARRMVARTERKLTASKKRVDAVFRRVLQDTSGWKRLSEKVAQAKAAGVSAEQLLALIQKARTRIERAGKRRPQDAASRTLVDQDSQEVAELIRAVRKNAIALNEKVSPKLSPSLRDIAKLDMAFSGSEVDQKVRAKEYKSAKAALDSLAGEVRSLIGKITSWATGAEEELARYVKAERVRFNETAG